MIYRKQLYTIAKMVAFVAALYLISQTTDITRCVISALGFSCLFALDYLLCRLYKSAKSTIIIQILLIVACAAVDANAYMPLLLVAVVELVDCLIGDSKKYWIILIVTVLQFIIFAPPIFSILIATAILIMLIYALEVLSKLERSREIHAQNTETIDLLNSKIKENYMYIESIKYTSQLEERNRLATRIHDKVGHGISGSIIMLEAAMLLLQTDPAKAASSIQLATSNLREGVDDIRAALREERPNQAVIGVSDVQEKLDLFKIQHNIKTTLIKSGRLDAITTEIWSIISHNLTETLTNILKHSNATVFVLGISVANKIIKVEYRDNGVSAKMPSPNLSKGIGLDCIEERVIKAGGRCFFEATPNGFLTTNIFIIK